MNNFYQKLIGLNIKNFRNDKREIVATWQHEDGVRLLVADENGETFIVDLPNANWDLELQ